MQLLTSFHLDCSQSPSNKEAPSQNDVQAANHPNDNERHKLDDENRALNALIADSNLLAAKTLDSLDLHERANGLDTHRTASHQPRHANEVDTSNGLESNSERSGYGRSYANGTQQSTNTEDGEEGSDMRDVCLGSDVVDGADDSKPFCGYIHDGVNGMCC